MSRRRDERSIIYAELAKLYGEGSRIPEDLIRARDFFEQASKGGDLWAMNELGMIYLYGAGAKEDLQRARGYFELAAEGELPDSLMALGVIYSLGLGGVPKNSESGFIYLERAADAGSLKAKEMLRKAGRRGKATARASSPSSSTASNTGVTCAEWLTKDSKAYIQFDYINEHNEMPIDSKDAVFRNLGKPTEEVHTGGSLVLLYRCTDGVIGIEVNLGAWNSMQMVITKRIEVMYH